MTNGAKIVIDRERPVFPSRAVVTAGMPYGNKLLHFGHIGGVFVQADFLARFFKDRLGKDNVIFVSGTDSYGSPIIVDYKEKIDSKEFDGSLDDFVLKNHDGQKEALDAYNVNLNLYAASSLGDANEKHKEFGNSFINNLYKNGHLEKMSIPQFYDAKANTFLNGRQVIGRCPVQGCQSDKAYADECSMGHQYKPKDLIAPKSVITGEVPKMKDVVNWYLKLPKFKELLRSWLDNSTEKTKARAFMNSSIAEFFEPPIIHITKDQIEALENIQNQLPKHETEEGKGKSLKLIFSDLETMETARQLLADNSIRYRTGKTMVPFRLTGNLDWGLPCPEIDSVDGLTFWVWPESLWAPISFTASYLQKEDEWKRWWCSKDAEVYQFIGEDNVFFYGLPEMGLFLGMQGENPVIEADGKPPEGEYQLPNLIANRHLLFMSKKASSSSSVKPPMAKELLDHYTSDQLRCHFVSLGLNTKSKSFCPKPFNESANERDADPVLKEGNLLSNTFNKSARSCFYTAQKLFDNHIPIGEISKDVLELSETVIIDYETAMYKTEFHKTIVLLSKYIKEINARWSKTKPYSEETPINEREQGLRDSFHMLRVATVLLHPIAPIGTEKIKEFLNVNEDFWSWDNIFETIFHFMPDAETHKLKELEPRMDFFEKHPSQFK